MAVSAPMLHLFSSLAACIYNLQGGSNGGLLMGNMITMRPDLFGAVVCQVPLLDMKRYARRFPHGELG
jgi:prolyl oligopeptidase PreP (S9A serine peptidase family)